MMWDLLRTVISKRLLIAVFFILQMVPPASGLSTEWRFSGKKAPSFLDVKMSRSKLLKLTCAKQLQVTYDAYVDRHEEFRPLKDTPGMYEKWRQATINHYRSLNDDVSTFCLYQDIIDKIWDFALNYHLGNSIFCGVPAKKIPEHSRKFTSLLEELQKYAFGGDYNVSLALISFHKELDAVNINPDVRFYIHALLEKHEPLAIKQSREQGYDYFPNEAEYGLSPDRLAEIREAAKRRDPSVVLNEFTTCSTEDL